MVVVDGEEVFEKNLLLTFLSLIEEVVEIQSSYCILYPKLERKNCTIKQYLCDSFFFFFCIKKPIHTVSISGKIICKYIKC